MDKIYVQVRDGFPIDVNVQNAIDGFEYLGYEPIKYQIEDILSGKMDSRAKISPFVGSIDAMSKLFKNIGKYPAPIDFPVSIINSGLLNREIKQMELNKAIELFKTNNSPLFIKPVKTKLFDGILVSEENHLHYFNGFETPEVLVSEKINIVSEHRAYIHKNQIVYCCSYSGDFRINPDYSYIDKLIQSYENSPIAYTIDVAVLEDGTNTVIEFNDFWAIGCYGLYSINYAEMLLDRYFEIVK